MKVLQINSVCRVGGSTGRITTEIYHALEEQGHSCLIVHGRGIAPPEIRTLKIGSRINIGIHCALTRLTDRNGAYSRFVTKKLVRQIKQYNPDIIHLHNIHGYYINIEVLFNYLREADKPVIWTLHDCWAFTGHCSHFDFVGCDKWKYGCGKCPQKKEYPSSVLFDHSRINYLKKKKWFTSISNMTLVTPSKWLAEQVESSFLKQYPVKVIHNGIDLNVLKPTPDTFRKNHGLTDKFIILGVASVWNERKGLSDFIELSKRLDNSHQIVLVGLYPEQLKKIPSNILGIIGTSNIEELAGIYTAADVFINTSVEETMGLVTVEALACGTPAIVYDATAVPEMVDATCGIVVPKNNIDCLVHAIMRIKNQPFSPQACTERAEQFDKQPLYQAYLDLYASCRQ